MNENAISFYQPVIVKLLRYTSACDPLFFEYADALHSSFLFFLQACFFFTFLIADEQEEEGLVGYLFIKYKTENRNK